MKLKEYIKELNEFVSSHPEALDYEAVYACDEEGNSYDKVIYGPTLGCFDGEYHGDFCSDIEEGQTINAVCVN